MCAWDQSNQAYTILKHHGLLNPRQGLILGLLETFVLFNIGVEFRELATFGILFLVLIVKPGGLIGGKSFMLSQEIDERV